MGHEHEGGQWEWNEGQKYRWDEKSEHEVLDEGSEHEVGMKEVSMRLGVREVSMALVCLKMWVQMALIKKRTNQLSPSLIALCKESRNVMEILCCHALRQHCTL